MKRSLIAFGYWWPVIELSTQFISGRLRSPAIQSGTPGWVLASDLTASQSSVTSSSGTFFENVQCILSRLE